MLLIVTNRSDLACDYLILRLMAREVPFIRLNTEDLGQEFWVDLMINKSRARFVIEFPNGTKLGPEDIVSVYFRQPNPPKVLGCSSNDDREFAEREALELLRSLWRMIPERMWLNHPRHLWRAANKVDQLLAAIEVGLDFPATLISSRKDSIAAFVKTTSGQVVAKAVKHGFLYRNEEIWVAATQRLSPDFLSDFHLYVETPSTFQHEIEKVYDIRVVVVREKVFATAIHSQVFEETAVDWRLGDLKQLQLHHERILLPKALEAKCRNLVDFFSLGYSSMDFVRGQDGAYQFLELNPNGQWAWIEQLVGYPIRDAIIDALTE